MTNQSLPDGYDGFVDPCRMTNGSEHALLYQWVDPDGDPILVDQHVG